MARTSLHAHLKPEIERLYCSGKVPADLFSLFPNIPQQTLRDWYKAGLDQSRWIEQAPPVLPCMAIREPSNADTTDNEGLSDYDWAHHQCKKLVTDAFSDATKIQALNVFVKLLQIKSTVQVETTVKTVDITEYKNMTTEELSRLYRSKLENNFN
jgi:hypothetical protein